MIYVVTSTNIRDVSSLVAAETGEAEASAALNTLPMVISGATTFALTEVIDLDSAGSALA